MEGVGGRGSDGCIEAIASNFPFVPGPGFHLSWVWVVVMKAEGETGGRATVGTFVALNFFLHCLLSAISLPFQEDVDTG